MFLQDNECNRWLQIPRNLGHRSRRSRRPVNWRCLGTTGTQSTPLTSMCLSGSLRKSQMTLRGWRWKTCQQSNCCIFQTQRTRLHHSCNRKALYFQEVKTQSLDIADMYCCSHENKRPVHKLCMVAPRQVPQSPPFTCILHCLQVQWRCLHTVRMLPMNLRPMLPSMYLLGTGCMSLNPEPP